MYLLIYIKLVQHWPDMSYRNLPKTLNLLGITSKELHRNDMLNHGWVSSWYLVFMQFSFYSIYYIFADQATAFFLVPFPNRFQHAHYHGYIYCITRHYLRLHQVQERSLTFMIPCYPQHIFTIPRGMYCYILMPFDSYYIIHWTAWRSSVMHVRFKLLELQIWLAEA